MWRAIKRIRTRNVRNLIRLPEDVEKILYMIQSLADSQDQDLRQMGMEYLRFWEVLETERLQAPEEMDGLPGG
jgi:hypothetical protein